MALQTEKQLLQQWNEYVENIRKQTALMQGENEQQQKKRIEILENDFELWAKYYFPQYCYAPAAAFHKKASQRIIKNLEWYEVRMWSRELAKSTRTMIEMMFLILTGKKKYLLLISNSFDNAERLLMPFKGNLEANQRIIHDYGVQEMPGKWEQSEFTTRKGAAFRALGAGQSPRGTRNDEARPDIILFDDIDTDEDCRNPDTIHKKWEWIEQAAIGTRSVSKSLTIIFLGNRIAEDCCVARASLMADHTSEVNIRDAEGNSTWPEKNTDEHIERVLSKISYATRQKEYYNNPISEGRVFKELFYNKCPKNVPIVIVYGDPSPSNKDRPGIKSKIQNSCKAVCIETYMDGKYYIYKMFVDQTTNYKFIEWLYIARQWIKDNLPENTQAFFYIENNTLQNPFYEQVLLPLIRDVATARKESILGVSPDARDKPDKYFRIEGTLEPLNTGGNLIFNKDEKDNANMKWTETQFKSVSTNSKTMDAPDCVEGATYILQQKITLLQPGQIKLFKRKPNNKRF